VAAPRPHPKPVDAYVLRPGETTESRDDRILDGLRGGDARALEAAFFAYYDGLFGHAYRFTRSREIAEELIQDVFLRMWERRDQLVGSERLLPLMFAAVRNAAISWLRRQRLERSFAESGTPGLSQYSSDVTDVAGWTQGRELARELQEAIETLPERARLAITLRWRRQLKNTEIAQVMGVSVKAVEFSIARALNHLRRILEPSR
jgi:RNA polymerase sigma-70 factor (ECF subfamily)